MSNKQLRFAAMVRVSSERQEKQGESLLTQRHSIERDVDKLGGKIFGWYGGQEHATPGWERKEVDRLIADAARSKFDAVIVAYADRWSRDNVKSSEGLDAFRENGVKFYVGTSEQNLFDPQVRFVLTMHAAVGEFIAAQQTKKSTESRIERAKRNVPTAGRLPYGRTFDRKTETWGVDLAKQELLRGIAERYLAGESLDHLAKEHGFHRSNLFRLLRNRAGTEWAVDFKLKNAGIDETVIMTVPSLLDAETIKAIRERMTARRTYLHPAPKPVHDYLLTGRLFCGECGYSLYGQTDKNGHKPCRYYRHNHEQGQCKVRPAPYVNAEWLEGEVLKHLFEMFGNPARIEKAIRRAVPDCDGLTKRKGKLDADLAKLQRSRDSILNLVADGALTHDQAKAKLASIKEREELLREERDLLAEQLVHLPDEQTLRRYVERIKTESGFTIAVRDEGGKLHSASGKCFDNYFVRDEDGKVHAAKPEDVAGFLDAMMGKDDRRHLIDAVFSRPMTDGKPAGIYVSPPGGAARSAHARNNSRKWVFTIKGMLEFERIYGSGEPVMPLPQQWPEPRQKRYWYS
jgi:DNA invertase Pin-like site-specific DNA recombinase